MRPPERTALKRGSLFNDARRAALLLFSRRVVHRKLVVAAPAGFELDRETVGAHVFVRARTSAARDVFQFLGAQGARSSIESSSQLLGGEFATVPRAQCHEVLCGDPRFVSHGLVRNAELASQR